MKDTYFDAFPIDNVKTLPLNKNEEIIGYIVNDFKSLTKDELFLNPQKKELKENQDFSKKLFHNLRLNNSYYTKTQKWLGHITEITDSGFNAILKDLTNGGTEEYGDFSNEEITPEDQSLVAIGAAFYMSLGFISNNGSRSKVSDIRFQRLADFDENEINNRGLDMSAELINYFK